MIPCIFLIDKLEEREMELYLLIEILNEVLNGRKTSRCSKISFGTEASQSDSFFKR